MWEVNLDDQRYLVKDLRIAYGTSSTYEEISSAYTQRVMKITHPLCPDRPFYASEINED